MKTNKSSIFLLFIVLFAKTISAQYSNLKFENLDISKGLSNGTCVEIFQDSKGFLWFGTNDGLNKYDGYQFKIFRPVLNNPNSISNSRINAIVEDGKNNLWVGTDDGLNVFNESKEVFIKIPLFKDKLHKDFINDLLLDETTNCLWVATNNGLFKIILNHIQKIKDYKNLEIHHYLNSKGDEKSISENNITGIIKDHHQEIWFVTNDDYLNKYNSSQNNFERVLINIPLPKKFDHISKSAIVDKDGDFWIGNNLSYLVFWNRKKNIFESISAANKDITIFDIFQDSNGTVWIATDGGGLYLVDKKTKEIKHIEHNPLDSFSLPNNQPSKIFEDQQGVFWIGSYNKGVSKLVLSKSLFGHYTYQVGKQNGLSGKIAQAVLEDSKHRIWIGTGTKGLNLFDEKNERFIHYRANKDDNNSLSSDKILSLSESSDGSIWIGTWDGGLNKLNPETQKIKRFLHNENDPFSIGQNTVWTTKEDNQNRLWIGTSTAGLNLFDASTEKFYSYKNTLTNKNSLPSNFVFSLFIDAKNRLLIGTSLGLVYTHLDSLKNNIPEKIKFYKVPEKSIQNIRINTITEDSLHHYWVGTDLGLYHLNSDFELIKVFATNNGLPNNIVIGVIEDNQGNIWITTKSGVSKFNPINSHFTNYNTNDGLQGLEFQSKSITKTHNGRLIMGGINGFNLFNPLDIFPETNAVTPIITNLKIYNKSIKVGDTINNRVLLTNPISYTKKLELNYNEGFLSFDFVALNYKNPDQVKYAYRLHGLEDDFILAENDRNVNYSNLLPGNYIFEVKATKNGRWDDAKTTKIDIVIYPPIWKTWWAYILYFLFGALLLWTIIYFYTAKIKENQEHELDQMKLQFFINVSHEFRTPLTLILNPVDKILSNLSDSETVKSSAISIQRSSRRLLHLVNQLLDYRKMDVGMSPLQLQKGNAIQFSKDLFNMFKDLANQKQIQYIFESSQNEIDTFFDHDKIEKILTNLIANAIKFTDVGGCIKVSIHQKKRVYKQPTTLFFKQRKEVDYMEIIVEDTGIGMNKEQTRRIFSRFYNVDANKTGTGIGLNFTKGLVEIHGGDIKVESQLKKGSKFTVYIPLKNEVKTDAVEKVKDEFFINTIKTLEYDILSTNTLLEEQESNSQKKSQTILIVEDNKELRTHLRNYLKPSYKIKEAVNGKEGLEMVKKHYPDMVISDVMMPKMDGFELCRNLKSDIEISHIPVILLTARTLEEDKIEGFVIGADEYLPKPFSMNVLEVRIKNILEAKKRLQEKFSKLGGILPSKELTTNNLDEEFLEKVTNFVIKNIEDPDFTLDDIRNEMGVGSSQFFRKVQSITGQNPSRFIRTIRLKYASELLLQRKYTIKEVAFKSGFNSSTYFGKAFKEQFKLTPKEYLNQKE